MNTTPFLKHLARNTQPNERFVKPLDAQLNSRQNTSFCGMPHVKTIIHPHVNRSPNQQQLPLARYIGVHLAMQLSLADPIWVWLQIKRSDFYQGSILLGGWLPGLSGRGLQASLVFKVACWFSVLPQCKSLPGQGPKGRGLRTLSWCLGLRLGP